MLRFLLYIIILPLVIWAVDGININSIFKRNRISLQFLNLSIIYLSFENNLYNFCNSQYLEKFFKINENNIYCDVIIY